MRFSSKQRRLIGQANDDARGIRTGAGIDIERVEKLHARPAAGFGDGGVGGVAGADRHVTIGNAVVVAGFDDVRAEDGDLRAAAGGGARGDEETASGAHVLGERIFEQRRQRVEIGENDESVIGWLAVGGLVDVDGFEGKGRLRGR